MSDEKDKDQDQDLVSVPLAKVRPDNALPVDVFVKVNEKNLKFKYAGDAISSDKYDLFLSKNISHLQINKNGEGAFNNWVKEVKDKEMNQIVSRVGEENRDLAETTVAMKENLYESFTTPDLKEAAVRLMMEDTGKFVKNLSSKKKNAEALTFLTNYNQNLADHSVSVASLSIFLALNLGQQHGLILENIYMGGLYHDYGKVKIPAKVLESKNTPAYINAMNVHAKMGFDALEKLNFLPKQILTIVLEHHEQFNGHGVPNKKKGEDIYGLTKIVSIANIFDNIVSEDKAKGVKNHFHRAFKILEMDNGRLFDPAVLKPALEALKEAYKNGEIAF